MNTKSLSYYRAQNAIQDFDYEGDIFYPQGVPAGRFGARAFWVEIESGFGVFTAMNAWDTQGLTKGAKGYAWFPALGN